MAMGQRRGDEKRIYKAAASCKNGKPTLFARESEVEVEAGFSASTGELPLFYVTSSPKLTRSRQVSRSSRIGTSPLQLPKARSGTHASRREVSADVHLGEGDPLTSTLSQEIVAWASSFRFDLDPQDAGRLQAMLERDARTSGRNLTDSRNWTDTPGGSFRFRNGPEEEQSHGSNRFAATDDDGSENHADAGDQARRNVAVDVPNSPERDEVQRRLNELKAAHQSGLRFGLDDVISSSLLRFGSPNLDDVATYHKQMAKLAARRHQRLQTGSSCSSPLSSKAPTQEITTELGELEIMPITMSKSSPSQIPQSSLQELHPTTSRLLKQSPRRSSSCSIQEQIVSICKLQFPARAASCKVSNFPSPDHTPFLSAARGSIPFKWEEEPGKPKSIAANAANVQRLPREETEVSNVVSESVTVDEVTGNGGASSSARSSTEGAGVGHGDGGRIESHRYYGRAHLRGHSESSLGQSSRRYGAHDRVEAQIDLDASAAAKFLVEIYDTPLSTPGRHSPSFAVPFKWEDAPGKAKVETPTGRPNLLQLPPRLAVPSCAKSFSRDLRASHPFAGFFAPCLTASSPGHSQQHQRKQSSDRILVQYGSSKSLPPRAPSSPRKRHGLVGRCYSTPQEGCQIRVSRSTASSPVLQSARRSFFSEEAENGNSPGPWLEKTSSENANANSHAPSSPRSILCGPDEGSSSSQASAASAVSSSRDLGDFTQQTKHGSASKSSNSSFESVEEDFADAPSPGSSHHSGDQPPASPPPNEAPSPQEEPPNASNDLNLSKTENHKPQKQEHEGEEPPAWSPALANYFDTLELTSSSTTTTTTTSTSTLPSTTISTLPSAGASTSAGALTASGELLPVVSKGALPTIQSMLEQEQEEIGVSAQGSPKRPTRLPYTMPSVADQVLASCENSTRRQLIQDLSPRLLRQYSGRRLNRSSHGRSTSGSAPRVERCRADEAPQTSSPAYAAALQLLSPPVDLARERQRKGAKLPLAKPLASTRPRRRARFMMSICKSLKRLVLGRQRRCKAVEKFEPKLMYDYAIAPTTFQLYQPNLR